MGTNRGNGLLATVEVKTATSYSVLREDSGKHFSNEGAGALVTFVLPACETGLGPYYFYNQQTNGLDITAGSGDTIRRAATVTAGAGTVSVVNVGDVIMMLGVNATEWVAMAMVGAVAPDFTVVNKVTTYTAAVGEYVEADATSAGFTVSLPASPAAGNTVNVAKTDSTSNIVKVAGNGKNINGESDADILNQYDVLTFVYGTSEWVVS